MKKIIAAITSVSLVTLGLMLAGCGGGGGLSSQVVSGSAAVGAPLSGQVSLKDSSATPQVKTTVIGSDGSFAIDVTGLQAPFILRAAGSAAGNAYTLHSFAEGSGIANINPLSELLVASAAGDEDVSLVYDHADREKLEKIKANLPAAMTTVMNKLQPLLQQYNAQNTNPITSRYTANHLGLDEMFDNVKISVGSGKLSIVQMKTGALIFSSRITDIANGVLNDVALPPQPAVPPAPASLTANGGKGQVTIAWPSVNNATSYNLYYAATSGVTSATGTKIAVPTNSYTHSGLAAATSYYYIVTALNSAGESVATAQATATTNPAPPVPSAPSAPAGVTATGGSRQATITWQPVAGAVTYNLYWSKTSGVTKASGTKIAEATSPAVHVGLTDSASYYYVVTAVNSAGESAESVQVAATTLAPVPAPAAPSAPTGVTATGGARQTTVSWSPVNGATSYTIYWSNSSGVSVSNGAKIGGATSPFVHTGLSAGASYYYVVTAVNSVGESVGSAQVSAATSAPPPSVPVAPANASATGSDSQISITWSPVPGASSYNLYWSKNSGVTTATGTRISAVSSPYVQTGLPAGAAYYYIVTAVNTAGEGPASAQTTAATNAPQVVIPTAPATVTSDGGSKQATISWSAVPAAASYNIYWSNSSGVTKASGTKISNASSPYVMSGLTDGATYYYIVTAVNSAGEGSASSITMATTTMPAPVLDGQTLYNQHCVSCHGTGKQGKSAAATQGAINGNIGGMGYLSTLTAAQIAAIATTVAPPPPAPVPVPVLDGAALYAQYCTSCHGSSKRGKSVAATQGAITRNIGGMGYLSTLTPAQLSAIAAW